MDLKFYGSSACNSGTNIVTTLGSVLDSDHLNENTGPEKVFDENMSSRWGGKWNNNVDKEFFVGYEFSSPETVLCASFLDDSEKGANTAKIQAYNDNLDAWVDFAEEAHTPGNRQNIMLSNQSTPTSSPTASPTLPMPSPPTSIPNGYRKWRLWSHESLIQSSGRWTVMDLKFYGSSACNSG